jgi:hypothetical protein
MPSAAPTLKLTGAALSACTGAARRRCRSPPAQLLFGEAHRRSDPDATIGPSEASGLPGFNDRGAPQRSAQATTSPRSGSMRTPKLGAMRGASLVPIADASRDVDSGRASCRAQGAYSTSTGDALTSARALRILSSPILLRLGSRRIARPRD